MTKSKKEKVLKEEKPVSTTEAETPSSSEPVVEEAKRPLPPPEAGMVGQLAALFFYESAQQGKGQSFENLTSSNKEPFYSLARATLRNINKLELRLAPALDRKKEQAAETILEERIREEVKKFFNGIKVWRRDLIPLEELVARIVGVFLNLEK